MISMPKFLLSVYRLCRIARSLSRVLANKTVSSAFQKLEIYSANRNSFLPSVCHPSLFNLTDVGSWLVIFIYICPLLVPFRVSLKRDK